MTLPEVLLIFAAWMAILLSGYGIVHEGHRVVAWLRRIREDE